MIKQITTGNITFNINTDKNETVFISRGTEYICTIFPKGKYHHGWTSRLGLRHALNPYGKTIHKDKATIIKGCKDMD